MFRPTDAGRAQLEAAKGASVNWLAAEQSNSSLTVGDVLMLKIYRRISPGIHPEAEMSRFLTERGFANSPQLFGDVVRIAQDGTQATIAVALGFVRHQGDAWTWTLDHLTRALDGMVQAEPAKDNEVELLADCNIVAAAIGRRLGEMHRILAGAAGESAFAPETATAADVTQWVEKIETRVAKAIDAVAGHKTWEREQDGERAKALLDRHDAIVASVRNLAKFGVDTLKTRIHGDFHLGQVLVASGDAFIIDFEGEPGTSVDARRAKDSPLRDVAGLLRSIHYAGATLTDRKGVGAIPVDDTWRDKLIAEFRRQAAEAFLRGYWETSVLKRDKASRALLSLFLIEKAAYEISYEAANRPTWLGVPLAGLLSVVEHINKESSGGQNG